MASVPKHVEETGPATDQVAAPCFKPSRAIRPKVSQILFIRAGGRCEREGCNVRLFEHHLSKQPGNYGDRAHIVAFSEQGPRGDDPSRPVDINDVDNLMALCKACHKEIDDHPERFTTNALKAMKEKHERRVDALLDASPDLASHIISFTAPIRGFRVEIPRGDMFEAILPRHPHDGRETRIDLGMLTGLSEDEAFLSTSCRVIDQDIAQAYRPGGPVEAAGRVALGQVRAPYGDARGDHRRGRPGAGVHAVPSDGPPARGD
ncbi:MAG: HNH endonuclease, partial [Pseudomonadota bacterium]